ncbi:hypothetical protein [Nocardioides aequoreus]|uniref:hypothetical protein n=1 Tax=Nocardioides aequoreus TaxID=397278 RepID=UPI0004C3169F|nr:hypothetical protein [Nocardioides aequoreus]
MTTSSRVRDVPAVSRETVSRSEPTRSGLHDLTTSVEFFVRDYLRRLGMETDGLAVTASEQVPDRPEVSGEVVVLEVHLPAHLPRTA